MDDLDAYLDLLGQDARLAGSPVRTVFTERGEVVLDGIVTSATTAEVPATAQAAMDQILLLADARRFKVRKVLPQPPDGALHLLVLAKA